MKLFKSIKVSTAATVSNVGCGFDILGFATDIICDEVTVTINDKKGITITKISGDNGKLPTIPQKNTCTKPMLEMLKVMQLKIGIDVEITKKIGFGSGLGSSAASAVAGAHALNELLGRPFSKLELLKFAMQGEKLASKSLHADNVAPCLFGGFILIRSLEPIDIIQLQTDNNLFCSIIYPKIEIKTIEARKILSRTISLKKGIAQWGNVGALVTGLITKNIDLVGRAVQDSVAEQKRALMIPGYYEIKKAALNAGAKGCNISGSGPSIFAFSNGKEDAWEIGNAMKKVVDSMNIENKIYVTQISKKGPRIDKYK